MPRLTTFMGRARENKKEAIAMGMAMVLEKARALEEPQAQVPTNSAGSSTLTISIGSPQLLPLGPRTCSMLIGVRMLAGHKRWTSMDLRVARRWTPLQEVPMIAAGMGTRIRSRSGPKLKCGTALRADGNAIDGRTVKILTSRRVVRQLTIG